MSFEQFSRALDGVIVDLGDGRGGALTRDPNTGAVMIRIVTGASSPLQQFTSGFGALGTGATTWGPLAALAAVFLVAAGALGFARRGRG